MYPDFKASPFRRYFNVTTGDLQLFEDWRESKKSNSLPGDYLSKTARTNYIISDGKAYKYNSEKDLYERIEID